MDLYLEFCSSGDPRYREIRRNHYVADKGAIGMQAHFLIHFRNEIAGIISGGSSVYRVATRDKFFGITNANRNNVLPGIVDNITFRLLNHEKNLGSMVLALWEKTMPQVWKELYGLQIFGFETFVEGPRKGTVYRATNWQYCGSTKGRATPLNIFCKWAPGFSTPIETEYRSYWKIATPEEKALAKEKSKIRKALLGQRFAA
jgi:hypothetical protein